MRLLLSVAALSVLAGYVVGGRARNLERLRLSWWGLAPLGLAMQVVPTAWAGEAARATAVGLLVGSYIVLLVFTLKNLRVAGFVVILLGLAMNLTVIISNGGMPVSCEALVASGQRDVCADLQEAPTTKRHLATPRDDLKVLADVIPIGPPINQVASLGDLIVYSGLSWLIVAGMKGRPFLHHRPRKHHRPHNAGASM